MKTISFIFFFSIMNVFYFSISTAGDVTLQMTTNDGSTNVEFQNSASGQVGTIDSTGKLTVSSHVKTGGYVSIPEMSNPGAASSGRVRLYAKDIGGTTYLAYIDDGGTERVIRPMRDYAVGGPELVATNLGTTYKDVNYGVTASALSRVTINFDGYEEARIVFAVDNNEADSITCRIYNVTTGAEITNASSDTSGNAQIVVGSWGNISLAGDDTIQAQCREGTGATSDPDIGIVHLQIR